MSKVCALLIASFFLWSCSTVPVVKVSKGMVIHEGVYNVPVINDENWVSLIPAQNIDGVYLKCPGSQSITLMYGVLCGKFNYAKLTPNDLLGRIYKNTYFGFWENANCPYPLSPLTDNDFVGLIEAPEINPQTRSFSLTYETKSPDFCTAEGGPASVKAMDVFVEDPTQHSYLGAHSRFVIFRYFSSPQKFEEGLPIFKSVVDGLQWVK